MAFDMGFDFRGTAGYVTDPAYGTPALGEAYPHTYTNGNGDSVNAGLSNSVDFYLDRKATNDPRIAGCLFKSNDGNARTWIVDLSSGSAPGAGNYTVDLAFGDPFPGARVIAAQLKDTSSTLIDFDNGGSGYSVASGDFLDATANSVTASTTWTGTTASVTFSTTTANLAIGDLSLSDYTCLAHFRLTAAATQSVVPVLMAEYRQRRN